VTIISIVLATLAGGVLSALAAALAGPHQLVPTRIGSCVSSDDVCPISKPAKPLDDTLALGGSRESNLEVIVAHGCFHQLENEHD
jgi:hypothetical protein